MSEQFFFRQPNSHDARAMRFLARETQVLSVNSTYYYALMARHFQSSCIVAESRGELCGYVTGFWTAEQLRTLFVWQVGVAKKWQGKGLGRQLLVALVQDKQPAFLEATIAPANQASINLFKSVARHFSAGHQFSEKPFFNEEDLGPDEGAEHLMRIGPLQPAP